jgi:hypothetical protein
MGGVTPCALWGRWWLSECRERLNACRRCWLEVEAAMSAHSCVSVKLRRSTLFVGLRSIGAGALVGHAVAGQDLAKGP